VNLILIGLSLEIITQKQVHLLVKITLFSKSMIHG